MMERSNQTLLKGLPERELVCLLGLPIDVIDMAGAMAAVRRSIAQRERLFLSTPNLNFLVASQSDSKFCESVMRSDLSLADGISLVLLGRILGANLPERVTGSDLFERLAREPNQPPIKVFLFGGPPGAGARAFARLNSSEFPGMTCVGFHEAGYGDVDSMSTPDIIDAVNRSGADFVVAALGAKKGQAWLLKNQHVLDAPVISHLGAVVNFMAGTVKRSPRWLQSMGLEWLWRIKEEPALWRRYWDDGRVFLALLLQHGISLAIAERHARRQSGEPGLITSDRIIGRRRHLALSGAWSGRELPLLRQALADLANHEVVFDLTQATWLDTRMLGYLSALHGRLIQAGGQGVSLKNAPPVLRRQIECAGATYLLEQGIPALERVKA